jgi:hypothetical protein
VIDAIYPKLAAGAKTCEPEVGLKNPTFHATVTWPAAWKF